MSYWSSEVAADFYAKGRPYFHPSVVAQVAEFLKDHVPFNNALDVGCGTGLSSRALQQVASQVRGIDTSPEMLRHVPTAPHLAFAQAPGEAIPFEDNSFDLITLAQSFHWLDRAKFFSEARRVLKSRGWIVVYDNYFSAMMQEKPDFQPWFAEYLSRFPTPPRPRVQFTPEDANAEGFDFVHKSMHEEWPEFTKESLTAYLLTQSNISAAMERGEPLESITDWMGSELSRFIPESGSVHIGFGSPIWYLRKVS
ncbi:MAG: class I SAM-dependent methyltransferase [Bacteroidota bacterium]|nr:class I SAM-dependent methyltransferase [Bacteroidota bacterium]MDP4233426.1 class I SAM-dependent methyltransferase [Bacteroidota bacterium]MDP4242292.1 class I SAM-dependent methyltransferase [Bacteroidota bacterium]MDP4287048.1 class I SAM-dependent methyltransferase [Bacteroidota bacterium]